MMTTSIQTRLQEIARSDCVPYLLELPKFAPHAGKLSLVLVGSAATGTCREDSDIDIAVVCDERTFACISAGTEWASGRPSEVEVSGIQLHYYGITFDTIELRLRDLHDAYIYLYSSAVALHDPEDCYVRRLYGLLAGDPDLRRQRVEGKLDMLLRRSRALDACLEEGDILTIGRVCLEIIALCVKVSALLDDTPFDPRKRLFGTGLAGRLGRRLEKDIRRLFAEIGGLADLASAEDFQAFAFPRRLEAIIRRLSDEARKQGFRVGIEKPDKRHMEPQ